MYYGYVNIIFKSILPLWDLFALFLQLPVKFNPFQKKKKNVG